LNNEIILYHHLGLGDHFTCNGLVQYLAKKYTKIHLACWKRYYETVSYLYKDNTNITVFGIENEPQDVLTYNPSLPLIRIGFEHTDPNNFERSFYSQLGLPYETRFEQFYLPKNLEGSKIFLQSVKQKLGDDFIFVHNQSSAGRFDLRIDSTLPRYTLEISDTPNLLDYVDTLKEAKEIHVINSGIVGLVINMFHCGMLVNSKIFYHNVRKFSQGGIPLEIPDEFIKVNYQ
jgi:hypothetical protein